MTYRQKLIERSLQFHDQQDEPAVLDYLQLRNRQCLYAWRMKREQHALSAVADQCLPAKDRSGATFA